MRNIYFGYVSGFPVRIRLSVFCFYYIRRLSGEFAEKCLLPLEESMQAYEKVQVGKDQEKAQSKKDSHSKNRGGEFLRTAKYIY